MKATEIAKLLDVSEEQIRKSKGSFRYHVSYFYRSGLTEEKLINRVKAKIPNAVIGESGDHMHSFVGSAKSGSAQDSFMWVKFTVLQVGDSVVATPKNNDFTHEFTGTIVGFKGEFIQVQDQENNVFDCDRDQLKVA